jgi:DUF4097 and DUF4098 domain-containing protein YvlB
MKKHLILSAIVLASLAGNSQSGSKTPFLTKEFANQSIKEVESKTSGGNISVSGGSGTPKVEVYVTPNNGRDNLSKEELQKRLDEDFTLTVSATAGKITATAKQKHQITNWNHTVNVSFKIFVPQNTSTDLRTSGGNITLDHLSGTQDFTTSGGNLDVAQLTGKIRGETSGGNIDVKDSKDDIDLGTSGGNIDAENCSGKIKLTTSGGNLDLRDLSGNIRATTSGGNVHGRTVGGELFAETSGGNVSLMNLSCSVEASTSGGDIDVEVKELGSYVKLRNSSGHVDLTIPANKGVDLRLSAEKIKTGTLTNFTGSAEDHEINGKINGGGVPVRVDANGGRISLAFK